MKTVSSAYISIFTSNSKSCFYTNPIKLVNPALDHDSVELKKLLGISYQEACLWIQKRLDKYTLKDCQKILSEKLKNSNDRKLVSALNALNQRYSLV